MKKSFVEWGTSYIDNSFIFSFSGLKTVALRGLKNMKNYGNR